ncbi:ADP-ribose pyrophosphatase YjhB (NUDIX family) [Streptomyces sp. Ag109_O5-1]|uniref:phage portal protein n=1 Tax=Streptomyces sp. Ag109_O5-1 TaxID=1938851 RepID=UPI000FB3C256|nr:phage portal protein [Streptomyces sp. Ag109_O5-1]RPE39753.1 ADP-ribose pyrophosphatase YjhB (NUDIX family) [Streptomyces sp. Ag109_O5-1]
MGVRSRLAQLRKAFAPGVPGAPEELEAGEAAAQMTPASPFSPGEPVAPYDGYSRTPRSQDYATGYNIATRPRTHERVAFSTLKGLIESYDVAQIAIWHRIDSIRSLDWSLIPSETHRGDVTEAIATGMAALAKPDRDQPFTTWLAAWLYDILAYDAGTLYRMRNRRGDAVGLRVVDGTTIAPLLDYWGNTPKDPAPAYVQYAQGLPWNWLRTRDLIYVPFRKIADSPYGTAPLESILLNANTDLRFQQYFLQRFTEGNIPEAFASAPETWSPEQIEEFQTYWDAAMYGDQAAKHQIKWLPGGSGISWSNEKDFSDSFSLFLMRKTAAAYHVVPSDLGFTETVNLSSSESQGDVGHRIGDLPLIRHVQGILTSFLQDDLGLPLQFAFDLGEEQVDRLQQAQADQIYVNLGAISPTDVREMRYGLSEPEGQPVPRFIYSTRSGPIPLSALYGVAGPIDRETAAPAPNAALPQTVFTGVEGTQPNPPIVNEPLAEQLYGPAAIPPGAQQVTDSGTDGSPTETPLGKEADPELAKREMTAFRTFRKARRRSRLWRDFEFRHVDERTGRRLNQAGRAQVCKDAGQVAVAGLAVQAEDTGRVLMIQRALDSTDPAAGTWEFPGGHLEGNETPLLGAWREWAEETGCIPPPGQQTGGWGCGIYEGIVWTVASEASVPLTGRDQVTNPDDPDGDQVEAIAWWDPAQLAGNPAVRPELLDALDAVLNALGCGDDEPAPLEKAGDGGPKGWPGWAADERVANYWVPLIATAAASTLTPQRAQQLARDYQDSGQGNDPTATSTALTAAAPAWLLSQGLDIASGLVQPLTGLYTDAYLVGSAAAAALVDGEPMRLGGWKPGDTDKAHAVLDTLGAAAGLAVLLDSIGQAADRFATSWLRGAAWALAHGTRSGMAPADIAAAMTQADPARLAAATTTEVTRVSGAAAQALYQRHDVREGRWLAEEDACPTCAANAAAGRVPIGAPYPSGDTSPPIHPNCRCAVVPA